MNSIIMNVFVCQQPVNCQSHVLTSNTIKKQKNKINPIETLAFIDITQKFESIHSIRIYVLIVIYIHITKKTFLFIFIRSRSKTNQFVPFQLPTHREALIL